MVVLDFVSGVVDSAWSTVKEVAGAAWDGVKTAVKGVANISKNLLQIAEPLLESISRVVPVIGKPMLTAIDIAVIVIQIIAQITGVLKEGENVEDIGAQALEAAERNVHPEDFDTTEKYFEYLRTIDATEISDKYSKLDKQIAGMNVTAWRLEQKDGIPPELYAVFVEHKDVFFTDDRIKAYAKFAMEEGISLIKLLALFSPNATIKEKYIAEDLLFKAEQSYDATTDRGEFTQKLNQILMRKHM